MNPIKHSELKIAIAFYGQYSSYYQYSLPKISDIYCYFADPTDLQQVENKHKIKQSKILNPEDLPICDEVIKPIKLLEFYLSGCKQMIFNSSIQYDIIIFTQFNTLYKCPTEKGEYYTKHYTCQPCFIETMKMLYSIEIISDIYIRENGSPPFNIYHLPSQSRQILFNNLFNNKVFEYSPKLHFEVQTCFLIPSVIHISSQPFNYQNRRSIFTDTERFNQTISQCQSISKIKNISAVLLEGSQLSLLELFQLSQYLTIILFNQDPEGYYYGNICSNKSCYEVYVLLKMIMRINADYYFKFGGRYHLAPSFSLSYFHKEKPVFKKVQRVKKNIIEAVLYSFPKSYKIKYIDIYTNILKVLNETNKAIEDTLYEFVNDDCYFINTLHIIGHDAIEGLSKIL